MANRSSLVLLALAAPATLLAFCFGGAWGAWGAALAGAAFPVALMGLGAARGGRLGALRWPLVVLGLVLAGGLAAVLALPDGGPDVLGLPLATAILIFGIIPVPLALVGLAYAATFERWTLPEEDLERIRRLARRDGEG
ncbi:MAG TPA: hypothetical protein VE685_13245 [Thermoanaerobaculia bacterium]|nr:hypothetical protein [Thermoanaerobaculia bacterium]